MTLRFHTNVYGSHHGQTDCTLVAFEGEQPVGYIDYSDFEGRPHINMISVGVQRRRGIASALIRELAKEYLYKTIQWGVVTPEGAALQKKMDREFGFDREAYWKRKIAEDMPRSVAEEPCICETPGCPECSLKPNALPHDDIEQLVQSTAMRLSYEDQTAEEIRSFLMERGLTSDEAYLVFRAAQNLVKSWEIQPNPIEFREQGGKLLCGLCFPYAHNNVIEDGGTLVHAIVTAPFSVPPQKYAHAWYERRGKVFDWQTMEAGHGGKYRNRGWPMKVFYDTFQPEGVKKYTPKEATIEALRHRHYGPWD